MNSQTQASTGPGRGSTNEGEALKKVLVWGFVVVVVVLFIVAVIPYSGRRASPELYATAAAVIPLLIVAIAVEQAWRGIGLKGRFPVVLALVVGEFAAMIGTAYDVEVKGRTRYLLLRQPSSPTCWSSLLWWVWG